MLKQSIKFFFSGFFFLYPLFFLYLTSESYEYNKFALLVVTDLVLFFLFTLKTIQEKELKIYHSSFLLPLFFLSLIFLISLWQSPNLVVALIHPLSTTTIIAGFLFYFFLTHFLEEEAYDNLFNILIVSTTLLALYTFLQFFGFLPQNSFTPAGTLLGTTIFFIIISLYLATKILRSWPLTKMGGNFFSFFANPPVLFCFLALLFIATAATAGIFQLLKTQKPLILPLKFGWLILLDILKDPRTMFFGIGPANFVTAFTLGKDVSFNQTPYWNVIFTSSSSFFLNLATEAGILAGLIFIFILFKVLALLKSSPNHYQFLIPLFFALFFLLFLPANMTLFLTTIIFLAFCAEKKILFSFDLKSLGKANYLFCFLPLTLSAFLFYFGGKAYLGEVFYKKSLDALLNNQGTEAYNLQIKALTFNPYLDRYHLAFSQTTLALANALAAKNNLSLEEQQKIPKFAQQAIDHAKKAVSLYPTNAIAWDNLAKIYSALSNYAQGADEWAEKTYQQKLLLDPFSPSTRLSFGGFYLAKGKWEEAEKLFRQAISLKPDYANAYYNLGIALKEQKKYQEAYENFQHALSLTSQNSPDSLKIQEEIKLLPLQK